VHCAFSILTVMNQLINLDMRTWISSSSIL
jgi:hypothetical protein